MTTKIFDTSSLLLLAGDDEKLFSQADNIVITNTTLKELENIKTSFNKDASIKYTARQLLHTLDNNLGQYIIIDYLPSYESWLQEHDIEINNDGKILAAAYHYMLAHKDCYFCTNDLALKHIASNYFGQNQVISIPIESDDYTGYCELYLSEDEMAHFYSNQKTCAESLGIQLGQYVNIYSQDTQERVDTLCCTEYGFRPLKYSSFCSKYLGEIKPYKGDIYQAMAFDSLLNNQITMIKGPAGTGKSIIALGYLFSLLSKGKIDKILIFCNTVATKNAARLGFYPGSKDEKLLDSQIGNFLASKLGSSYATEQLINEEKLILLPMSDIRGYDTSGMHAGIYITEAQNLDVDLLKLALQRAGEDSIFILDGDVNSQVDLVDYDGVNNGMRRASKVFRGTEVYGEVELQTIHRSRIAEIANNM